MATRSRQLKDAEGNPVPERLAHVFAIRDNFKVAETAAGALQCAMLEASRVFPRGLIDYPEFDRLMSEISVHISRAKPHIVCRRCNGSGCNPCGGYGFTREGQ